MMSNNDVIYMFVYAEVSFIKLAYVFMITG